jgi:curved DNA-binding protein CbpA
MTREEALDVLGLSPDATPADVLAEYRRLMKKVHPDQGGTTYLATRLNEAKDVLLGDG